MKLPVQRTLLYYLPLVVNVVLATYLGWQLLQVTPFERDSRVFMFAILYGLGGMVVAVACWPSLDWARRPFSVGQELALLTDVLPTIDPACTLTVWFPPWDAELKVADDLSQALGLDTRWRVIPRDPAPPPGSCVLWYRAASCSLRLEPGTPDDCTRFEAEHHLTPLVETHLTPREWLLTGYYLSPEVRVGLYRATPAGAPP